MNYTFSDKIASLKPSAIREILKAPATPETISFAAGNPAPESFPIEEMARISEKIFKEQAVAALQYSVTDGYSPLREHIAARQKEKFNIGKSKSDGYGFDDTAIIVSGGQQGIELACKVFCNEGDAVICENPTFIGALNAFRSNGATPIGVTLEDDGMNIEELESVIKATPNAKLIYVIPTFQNPGGITTSYEKRVKIYELAKKYGLMILEDNPYGELRFAGENVPTYKSMDTDGRVMYCGSFSKILSAGMRVGFVCGNETVVQKMVVAKQVEDVHTNQFFQMIVAGFMQECDMDAHIAKIRALYKHKAELMISALDKYMPKEVKFTRPEGGLFLWCTLPEGVSLADFMKESIEQKVFVVTGKAFNCDEAADSDSFRLNYSMPSDEEIDKGVRILGEIIGKLMNRR
jgi:2-aminoadipate transaminase